MAQLVLPFPYEVDSNGESTAYAGLPLYYELSIVSGVISSIARHVPVRKAGWDDVSVLLGPQIVSLFLLQGIFSLSAIECILMILEKLFAIRSLLL